VGNCYPEEGKGYPEEDKLLPGMLLVVKNLQMEELHLWMQVGRETHPIHMAFHLVQGKVESLGRVEVGLQMVAGGNEPFLLQVGKAPRQWTGRVLQLVVEADHHLPFDQWEGRVVVHPQQILLVDCFEIQIPMPSLFLLRVRTQGTIDQSKDAARS